MKCLKFKDNPKQALATASPDFNETSFSAEFPPDIMAILILPPRTP